MVEACVSSRSLNEEGYAVDFLDIKTVLDDLAARFHHNDINSVAPFDSRSPTTEHLAQWFWERLDERLPEVTVASVEVHEGPDFSATYFPPSGGSE